MCQDKMTVYLHSYSILYRERWMRSNRKQKKDANSLPSYVALMKYMQTTILYKQLICKLYALEYEWTRCVTESDIPTEGQ